MSRPALYRPFLFALLGITLVSKVAAGGSDSDKEQETVLENKSESACRESGFEKESLFCGVCERLVEVAKSEDQLRIDCQSCCRREEVSKTMKTYSAATLYVDQWIVESKYPMIYNFINEKMDKYAGFVKVKYHRKGFRPYFNIKDKKGKVIEKISIASWRTEDIEDFLDNEFTS
mmetsp:Transcript_15557/g.19269  ORF Transcript_15557/g.19269 Transcript_15557/m.19269 type:complete len:175 (-) Transcript_15557:1908-2432(-)